MSQETKQSLPRLPKDTLNRLMPGLHKTAIAASSAQIVNRKNKARYDAEIEASGKPEKEARAELGLAKPKELTSPQAKLGALIARIEHITANEELRRRSVDYLKEGLVVEFEDIPESYWKQQGQIARDNGLTVELDDYQKQELARQLQDAQRTGLDSWLNYLEQTGEQYPAWFKIYVLDGMSRLGVFNTKTRQYNRRDDDTVAPYPMLNPAALAKTYDAVGKYYQEQNKDQEGNDLLDSSAKELVANGNFNQIYSHFLLETKSLVPTPEHPEDVRGEWREYTGADVIAITKAAEGTPWCIAGEATARAYTKNEGDKFYLFHLQDGKTGQMSQTAAASIRMEYGVVTEISGLKDGNNQFVEDALVPTVEQKVQMLPGGEKYMLAFADKQRLIAMDRKFQSEGFEGFTGEELRFLYGVDRPIQFIDTYTRDPRVDEFTEVPVDWVKLLEVEGFSVEDVLKMMKRTDIIKNLEILRPKITNPEQTAKLLDRLSSWEIVENLNALTSYNIEIDVKKLALDITKARGYHLRDIDDILWLFSDIGADMDTIAKNLKPEELDRYAVFKLLEKFKVSPRSILDKLSDSVIDDSATTLLKNGAPYDLVFEAVGRVHKSGVSELELYDEMVRNGTDIPIDIDTLARKAIEFQKTLKRGLPGFVAEYLLKFGASPAIYIPFTGRYFLSEHAVDILNQGHDTNMLLELFGADLTRSYLEELLIAGASPRAIIRKLSEGEYLEFVKKNLDTLKEFDPSLTVDEVEYVFGLQRA